MDPLDEYPTYGKVHDFLRDNLLDDDDPLSPPLSVVADDFTLPPGSRAHIRDFNSGTNRLVIGIDYGTTFTG